MYISKIIIYYTILYLIYKLYKLKFINKEFLNDELDDDIIDKHFISNICVNSSLIIYKPKKKSNYNLNEIYDNFFNNKKKKLNNKFDLSLININNNDNSNRIILSENNNNFIINHNLLKFNFKSNKNSYYKIKFKVSINNIQNIKLIIANDKKRFIYDFYKNNLIDKYNIININEYGFILNNNNFNIDDDIHIYIIFNEDIHNTENNIYCNNYSINVTEYDANNINIPIIIFNVNNIYYPIYLENKNILDYNEHIDTSTVFFI